MKNYQRTIIAGICSLFVAGNGPSIIPHAVVCGGCSRGAVSHFISLATQGFDIIWVEVVRPRSAADQVDNILCQPLFVSSLGREIWSDVNMKEASEWLRGVVWFTTSAKRGIYQQERDVLIQQASSKSFSLKGLAPSRPRLQPGSRRTAS